MSLRVFADKAKSVLVCDIGAVHRVCNVAAGGAFSVDVVANGPPPLGYTAYQAVLQYAASVTLQQQPGLSENQAPACFPGSESKLDPAAGQPGRYSINCKLSTQKTHYSGTLANVQFVCPAAGGKAQIDLVGGSGAKVSTYVNPSIFGSLIFLKSTAKDGKQVADSVLVNCLADVDGDGCTNVQEWGQDPRLGGLRDPMYRWDFYDVWTPAGSPGGWVRDRAVTIFDVFAVARRFGAARGTPPTRGEALTEALATPASATGYHTAFDRGAANGPNAWNRAPPDGWISVVHDILGVARQFGHSCA